MGAKISQHLNQSLIDIKKKKNNEEQPPDALGDDILSQRLEKDLKKYAFLY
jgi:hypothetical protein